VVDGPLRARRRQGERQGLSPAGSANLPKDFDRDFQAILDRGPRQEERAAFQKYLDLLIKWGSVHRLVGSTDPAWIVEHLFLDSLLFLKVLPPEARSILDFGAGAGLPGIPIAIVRPEAELSLLESKRRRASFLLTAVRELGLSRTRVLDARSEELEETLGGTFDAVVMRCAGKLDRTMPLAARFAKPGGLVIASGPPVSGRLEMGRWLEIPGIQKGSTRRFAVLAPPGS
jgi:16S rRNA (guanine527-N7)-methyltransferase